MSATTAYCASAEELLAALKEPLALTSLEVRAIDDEHLVGRIAECANLESLNVTMCASRGLAARLGELSQLRKLTFQRCDLEEIPPSVFQLDQLESLNLGNNQIAVVPDEIGAMKSLTMLRLMQNRIKALPDALCALPIGSLNLGLNRLQSLPEVLGRLADLRVLLLGDNQLSALPDSIGDLRSLTTLELAGNGLQTLPASIGRLDKLESLSLEKNPFTLLPPQVKELAATVPSFSISAEHRPLLEDWSYPAGDQDPLMSVEEMRLLLDAGDPAYDDFVARLVEISAEELLPLARRCIVIRSIEPDAYAVKGASRLGGFPDLASSSDFPLRDGAYAAFLAQLDLADIASLNDFLPKDGLLSFFIDSTEDLNATVVYTEAGAGLETMRINPADMWDPDDDYSATPHKVRFEPAIDVPYLADADGVDPEAFDRVYSELGLSGVHKINGYGSPDLRPGQEAAKALRGQPEEWVPLLILEFDQSVGFNFWDVGTLIFSIHQEALRRWDFSNVHCSLITS